MMSKENLVKPCVEVLTHRKRIIKILAGNVDIIQCIKTKSEGNRAKLSDGEVSHWKQRRSPANVVTIQYIITKSEGKFI